MYINITTEFEGQRQFESCSSSDDNEHITKAIGNGVTDANSGQCPKVNAIIPSPPSNNESDAQPKSTESDL